PACYHAAMRRLALLIVASVLPGCALFVPKLEMPALSIVGVELERGDLFEQHLKVRMRVDNPNARELPVKGLSYTLEIGGEQLAHGESAASFTVPARGEADFDMSVTANMAGAFVRLLSHPGDDIEYRLAGRVTLAQGLW